MTLLEFIGGAASVLALLEIGYEAGKWRAGKSRRVSEDELIAGRLQSVLGAVRITHLDCEPHSVAPGQTILMLFSIDSEVGFPYPVWLGASAVDPTGHEYWKVEQDMPVVLERGSQMCSRELTIPHGVQSGTQRLIGTVWLGKRGHTEQSIQIGRLERQDILTVK